VSPQEAVTGEADISRKTIPPLDRGPRRIRPPFSVGGPFDRVPDLSGETNDEWRQRVRADRVAALLEALEATGVEVGAYDHRIVEWLAEMDTSTQGTVTSWLYRAFEAGACRQEPDAMVFSRVAGERASKSVDALMGTVRSIEQELRADR
jgi:hypothetical protein